MDIIVVSDVFGKTSALITLAQALKASKIIDPYHGVDMNFNSESEAYAYFIEQVGLDDYLTILMTQIESVNEPVMLIGFSVGASSIWRLSEKVTKDCISRAVCFYGSQIRNYTHIEPQFEIELIFPKNESHFDVQQLKSQLASKKMVKTSQVEYHHGFMNYLSNNFNPKAYQQYINYMCSNATHKHCCFTL